MKTISRTRKTLWAAASSLLVVALTAAAFVAVPAAPAYADDGTPPTPERSRDRGARLEQVFEREKDWLSRQSDNLGKAGAASEKLSGLIEKAKANGVDVSSLEAALATFESQIAVAGRQHEQAAAVIDAHAGFNGGGKVLDPAQALETVKSAGSALREAAQTMKDAGQALREAVKAWREAHPRPQPTAEPAGA